MEVLAITIFRPIFLTIITFILIVIFCFLGFKRRQSRLKKFTEEQIDISFFSGSVLGLLALIISFTFNIAFSRYDARRQIIVQEANEIGTAILRTDLYPDSIASQMKDEFKKYIDARIAYYEAGADMKRVNETLSETTKHSDSIWKIMTLQTRDPTSLIRSNQMIPAMNAVIDIVTTREKLRTAYIPDSMLAVLMALIIICSFMIGFNIKTKRTVPVISFMFAFIISITIFLILDLVHSTFGLITQEAAEQSIIKLKSLIP